MKGLRPFHTFLEFVDSLKELPPIGSSSLQIQQTRHKSLWLLFNDLSGEPHDQAGTPDGKKDAGYPAPAAYSQKVSHKAADETADNTKERILEKALWISIHDLIGYRSGQSPDNQGCQQVKQHIVSFLSFRSIFRQSGKRLSPHEL